MDGGLEVAKIPTPAVAGFLRLWSAALAEQLQIAAVDEGKATFDESDDGITQRRCLPGLGLDASIVVDRDGDLVIGRAFLVAMGGVVFLALAPPLLGGHARVTWRRTSAPSVGHPRQGVDAIEYVAVERDHRCELVVWNCAGKEENPEVVFGEGRIGAFRSITPCGERAGG